MNLPQDPFMKSQQLNMMLKANNMDLETLCTSTGIDMIQLEAELGHAGIRYNSTNDQFTL